ncbi:MAG: hypothetical protein WC867_05925 [Candidatus Pacearchaeota archaeon]|jgi:hypothetical protein
MRYKFVTFGLIILMLLNAVLAADVYVGSGMKARVRAITGVPEVIEPTNTIDSVTTTDPKDSEYCPDCVPTLNKNIKLVPKTNSSDIIEEKEVKNKVTGYSIFPVQEKTLTITMQIVIVLLIALMFFLIGYLRTNFALVRRRG